MSQWLCHEYLRSIGRQVNDGLGRKIDAVRAVKVEDGGIRVRVLHTANGGESPVIAGNEVVEFEAFVPGGKVTLG
jgi:hypothetical protein